MESDNNKDNQEMSDKNLDTKPFIGRNETFIFAHKKTEKLASAIYMVTNLLSDSEPMKWSLRKKSSELVSLIILYKDIPESQLFDFIKEVRTKVLELVSMLEISSLAGLVSLMNFSVLKQEFSNLITMFNVSHEDIKHWKSGAIPKHFFDVTEKDKTPNNFINFSQRHGSRTNDGFLRTIPENPSIKANVFGRSNRQNIIVNLLKKKGDLTIRDMSQVIRDCSEKTIQRELISLISMGVVKKEGERRWSKYSLSLGN